MSVVPSRSRPLLSEEEPEVDFATLGLIEPLLRAVRKAGYQKATPIQASAVPPALAGRDVLGAAQTGTGKTAAFALPLLQHLSLQERPRSVRRAVRALILSPTRELASQIEASIATYGQSVDIRHTVIFGGVSASAQVRALELGVDVVVATPGRLWDLLQQKLLDLSQVQILVLDEVDRMLDQGFWPTVRRIVAKVPKKRQTLAFSATMPDALRPLISELLIDPVRVSVTKESSTPCEIEQRVHFVPDPMHKRALLADLISDESVERVIVFTKTKHGANRVTKHLDSSGIRAEAIHGNKSQNARERALEGFRGGEVRVLVATDIAARGLDIKGISHVVNYDLPVDAESYVHRIGRTARAGTSGIAISLCSHDERPLLLKIEKLIGRRVPVAAERPASARRSSEETRALPERAIERRGNDDRRPTVVTREERRPASRPAARDDRRDPAPRAREERRPIVQQAPRDDRRSESRPAARDDGRESAPRVREERRPAAQQTLRDDRRDSAPRTRDSRQEAPRTSEVRREPARIREDERAPLRARVEVRDTSRSNDDRRETPLVLDDHRDASRTRDDRRPAVVRTDRRDAPRASSAQVTRSPSREAAPRGQASDAARRQTKPRSAY